MATVTISDERRLDLLTSALEGGSNYWYWLGKVANQRIDEVCPSDGKICYVDRLWAALKAGKQLPVHDIENKEKVGYLSKESMDKGEQLMADKYPEHFADVLNENDDATTGDVFFQLSVMGKVIYG